MFVSWGVGKLFFAPVSIFSAGAIVSTLASGGVALDEFGTLGATLSGGAFRSAGGAVRIAPPVSRCGATSAYDSFGLGYARRYVAIPPKKTSGGRAGMSA